MNKTEKLALSWLSETYGVSESNIAFSSNTTPDFVLPDGQGFEVKRLYGDKIIIYPDQIKALEEDPRHTVLVFKADGKEPTAEIPVGELLAALSDGSKTWQNIKIVIPGARLQIFIDPSIRDAIDTVLKEKYGSSSRGLSMVVRTALTRYLRDEGYLKQ